VTLAITSVVVILSSVMLALGLKVYIKVQAICALVGLVMLVVAAALFATTSNAEWQTTWNTYAASRERPTTTRQLQMRLSILRHQGSRSGMLASRSAFCLSDSGS